MAGKNKTHRKKLVKKVAKKLIKKAKKAAKQERKKKEKLNSELENAGAENTDLEYTEDAAELPPSPFSS